MLFKFIFRVSFFKMYYFKWVKCRIVVCDNMVLDAKKRGGAIIRGGAIFGGNTISLSDCVLINPFATVKSNFKSPASTEVSGFSTMWLISTP